MKPQQLAFAALLPHSRCYSLEKSVRLSSLLLEGSRLLLSCSHSCLSGSTCGNSQESSESGDLQKEVLVAWRAF